MKLAEDFKTQAKIHNITYWHLRNCSMCDYELGYYFRDDERVEYDNGCGCTGGSSFSQRTWQDIADHYNMQTHPEYIKKMNAFWKFES